MVELFYTKCSPNIIMPYGIRKPRIYNIVNKPQPTSINIIMNVLTSIQHNLKYCSKFLCFGFFIVVYQVFINPVVIELRAPLFCRNICALSFGINLTFVNQQVARPGEPGSFVSSYRSFCALSSSRRMQSSANSMQLQQLSWQNFLRF